MLTVLLKKAKMTQCQVADKLKVSQQAVSAWCIGRNKPSLIQATKLAEVLGVTINEIVNCFNK